ncbi:putative mitochondrial protein [Cucumis melo var. makuwa]|uniref:Mitochondrial protein n=1 Tax=Cucumis melo var. makuwa TaxID=1194695 RepID=A0A5D3E5K7_CUCMM|nr:putative mitochondrial protein [Cucumis melo var. makuwa]TYK31407.1 putative mitochondrial protein [Cucumis melo var. makuwa]
MGNQFLFVSSARNNSIPRISVGNSTISPQEVTNVPPTSNRTQGIHVRETASTSQPTGPTASQASSTTLSAIAQSGMSQSLGLISVDGKNPWILDSGATYHLTGFSKHFVSYTFVPEESQVRSSSSQPLAPIQDFKPPRDQSMENPTKPCTNNTMNKNDRSDVVVLENLEEKNSGEVRTETSSNEAEQGHTGKLDKYDPSFDVPIALRKEIKALEKNNTREICALLKGHKPVRRKWVFTLKYKADGTLDRHQARSSRGGLHESRLALKPNLSQWYNQGHSNHTLFTKVSKTEKIAILIVYVDDTVLSEDDQAEISQLKQRMGNKFEIKDLGNLKYFLGMEVVRSKEGISVSQRKYTFDLLTKTGLMFGMTDRKTIEAYTDSDWAGSVVDKKSTSGYCTFVWGNLVTWRSKKQSVVARSSTEVEYRAMSLEICKEIWLQNVLSDLHQECETPLKLFVIIKTLLVLLTTQFSMIELNMLRLIGIKERLGSGSICIPYIHSSQQVADVLTKGLLRQNLDFCVSTLGLIDIYVPTREGVLKLVGLAH